MHRFLPLFVVLSGALFPWDAPVLGQAPGDPADEGRPGSIRAFVRVDGGLFLDVFATDGALVPILGGGAALEIPLSDRWALRGDVGVIIGLSNTVAGEIDRGEAVVLVGPGFRFCLEDGPGDRPHLRFGVSVPAIGDPEVFLPHLGVGIPVGGRIRLQARSSVLVSQAGLSVALP